MLEVKNTQGISDVDTKGRTVVGYAAKFGNVDRHNDIIAQNAFARTLEQSGTKVRALLHHDPTMVAGPVKVVKSDDVGLYTETLVSKTAIGNDLLTLLADGALDGMSIGFRTRKSDTDEETTIRTIKEIDLYEYSFVAIPANPEATVTGLKALGGTGDLDDLLTRMRKFEHALRHGVFDSDEVPVMMEIAVKQWTAVLEDFKLPHPDEQSAAEGGNPDEKSASHSEGEASDPGEEPAPTLVGLANLIQGKSSQIEFANRLNALKSTLERM